MPLSKTSMTFKNFKDLLVSLTLPCLHYGSEANSQASPHFVDQTDTDYPLKHSHHHVYHMTEVLEYILLTWCKLHYPLGMAPDHLTGTYNTSETVSGMVNNPFLRAPCMWQHTIQYLAKISLGKYHQLQSVVSVPHMPRFDDWRFTS